MDLDALSGVIAYKHTGDEVTTVTAAFDRITINSPLKEICDLELSGQVTYATGRSSMEISLQAAKAPAEGQKVKDEDILLSCTCTMVSLDPKTKKPVPINPIIAETPKERRLFELGKQNSMNRKVLGRRSLIKHTPNDEESDLIHALWQKQLRWHGSSLCISCVARSTKIFVQTQMTVSANLIAYPLWRTQFFVRQQSCSLNSEIGIT